MTARAVVVDIEGTTSSTASVHVDLYDYAWPRLRPWIEDHADDDEVAAAIERAVGTKWAGHMINTVNFVRPAKSMSQIGG